MDKQTLSNFQPFIRVYNKALEVPLDEGEHLSN